VRDGTEDEMISDDEWDEDLSDEELQARWENGVPVEVVPHLRGTSGLLLETNLSFRDLGLTWRPGSSPRVQPPQISPTGEPKVSA